MDNGEARKHLRRQIDFIERSCRAFDAGERDDAVRIGTALRVMFHDPERGRAISIMRHLGNPPVRLLSTCRDIDPRVIFAGSGLSVGRIVMSGGQGIIAATHEPCLGTRSDVHRLIVWQDWWTQAVYLLNGNRVSRKQIVRNVTDKDGGAHVDEHVPDDYRLLQGGLMTAFSSGPGGERHTAMPDAQFADLRQMGYEILNSPELLALLPT